MVRALVYTTALCAIIFECALAQAAPPKITDIQAISLHNGVNSVPGLTPDGRAGTIVRAGHNSSPIADGASIDYMVLAPRRSGGWVAVDAEKTPSLIADEPFGGVLLSAAPHTGEDWKRSVTFARGRLAGTRTLFMILGERDLKEAIDPYTPVPVEVSVFRLVADPDFEDDFHLRAYLPSARRAVTSMFNSPSKT